MTPDPREHVVLGAVAAVTPEISTPVNLSTEQEMADLNNTRLSDRNGSDSVSNGSSDNVKKFRKLREDGFVGKCWAVISFTPLRCKWDPEKSSTDQPRLEHSVFLRMSVLLSPFFSKFKCVFESLGMSDFCIESPCLRQSSLSFVNPLICVKSYFEELMASRHRQLQLPIFIPTTLFPVSLPSISYEEASNIPTVMQAGYATSLLFLCPLGDIFRPRAFVLILTWFTATLVSLHLVAFQSIDAEELSAVAWPLLDQEI